MKHLFILSCSMRSHTTNEYQLLSDSSINCILHRLSSMEEDDEATITIPTRYSEDFKQLLNIVSSFKCKVSIQLVEYGTNIEDTRNIIDNNLDDIDFYSYDMVESQFCTVTPRLTPSKWTYNIFNSAVLDQSRPSVEKHFFQLLRNLKDGYFTFFSCENQRALLPEPLHIFYSSLKNKFFSPEFADYMMDTYYDRDLEMELDAMIPKDSVFFPFRASDPCYKAEEVDKLQMPIIVTDPNNSAGKVFTSQLLDISSLNSCKKTLYLTMLHLLRKRPDIRIPLYEDITTNYHIGIVEMVYYCSENIDFLYSDVDISYLRNRYII